MGLCAFAPAQNSAVKWATEKVVKRVKVFGFRRLAYHNHNVTGDKSAYGITNYGGFGNNRFTDLGFVRMEGSQVFGWLNFEANLQDSRFTDPQTGQYRMWTTTGGLSLEYGDVQTSIAQTNQFARLNKNMTGLNAVYSLGRTNLKFSYSSSRGEARTVTIQGANTAGPYYLQSSQIIRGSERVEVDGVLQELGTDYTVDYDLGTVTFVDRVSLQAKVIPPTSTIVATYESFAINSAAGRLTAGSASYDLGKAGRIGVVAMHQSAGTAAGDSTRLEKFQGFGAPSTPYFLQFEPLLTKPIVIRVDGILQTQGIDYVFDTNNASIFYFTRFMPSTSLIDVEYTPKPSLFEDGDRTVRGIDYSVNFGRTRLSMSLARGELTNSATPRSGTARGINIRSELGKWQLSGNVRDIEDGYTNIDTTSFSRNEKMWDASLRRDFGSGGVLTVSALNSLISGLPTSTSTAASRTRFTRAGASYVVNPGGAKGLPLNLSYYRTMSKTGSSESNVDTASLSTRKQFGKLNTQLSLENSHVTGTQQVDVLSTNFRATYESDRTLNFALGASLSSLRGSTSGTGREMSLSATYRPSEKFVASASWTDGNSGGVSLAGYTSGFGAGYNGNGFSSGTSTPLFNGPTNGKSLRLVTDWEVSDRLHVSAAAVSFESTGNFSANAKTDAVSLSGDYDFGGTHRISGSVDSSRTRYIGSSASSTATTLNMFASGGPIGRLSYRAGISALVSGGSSTFQQDSFAWDFGLSYRLGRRDTLSLEASQGDTRGYLPQTDLDFSLVYRYQIWQNLALNVGYRFRDVKNNDPLVTSGAYRSSGFDVELAFNFSG